MRPAARLLDAPARGFVLVGVVMMVLALTIIGLSLYSLSGYESQFFGRSLFDRQAFYSASGGVELAKALLSTPLGSPPDYRLSNVSRAVGREGVVSAVAWQDGPPADSSGSIDWDAPIHLRVGVSVNGVQRTVEGTFDGGEQRNPYHYVFTCPGTITTQVEGNNRPLALIGEVWQTIRDEDNDKRWTAALDAQSSITFADGDAPHPASAEFIAAHAPGDTATRRYPDSPDSSLVLTMDARMSPNQVRFFAPHVDSLTLSTGNLAFFDTYTQRNTYIQVAGTAVWIVPRGTRFENEFTVRLIPGASSGTLVMVVGPNERWPGSTEVGPWFEKGIQISPVVVGGALPSVFLVTHGTARIHDEIQTQDIFARRISVFANNIDFQGPPYNMPRDNMWLEYGNSMKSLATTLKSLGALPGTTGMSPNTWALRRGTWTSSPGLQ